MRAVICMRVCVCVRARTPGLDSRHFKDARDFVLLSIGVTAIQAICVVVELVFRTL